MAIGTFRIGHAGAAKNIHKKAVKRASCSTGFITAPSSGQVVDVGDDVMFAWDTSCLNITGADIYLYAPYQATTLVQMFQNVDFTKGSYNATLKPKWWNSTSSVDMQLTIVQTGTPEIFASLPPGPIWTAKYDSSAKNTDDSAVGTTSSGDANVTQVNNLTTDKGGISKGGIAAVVIFSLLAVALVLFAYIKITRKREEKRRKRWSEMVDKRMSVISGDWRSISVKGAEAAIRASMADPSRASIWSGAGNAGVGIPRPSSAYAAEGASSDGQPEMGQIRRTGVGLRGPIASSAGSAGRVSRVSFAADTRFSRTSTGDGLGSRGRPSVDSRRAGVPSRAFHSAYIPPVPIPSRLSEYVPEVETNNSSDADDNNAIMLSPTQRSGPLDLSADEIRARMNGDNENESRPSLDAVLPALSLMRTGNDSQADLLFSHSEHKQSQPMRVETSVPMPAAPPPAATAKSPIMEAMPMTPLSAASAAMSPDEMLRAYAERRRTGGSGIASPPGTPAPTISFPMPVLNASAMTSPPPSAPAMRTLYSPPPSSMTFGAPGTAMGLDNAAMRLRSDSSSTDTNPFRKSMAATRSSTDTQNADEDAHVGSAH
ncbi:hypothetical protein ACEPAG_2648 [Sanghuangporus baumii]